VHATLEEMLDLTVHRRGYRDAVLASTINICCCCSCCCGSVPTPF
jgi:hypothetical protein